MEIFVTVNAVGTVGTARPVVQWYGNGYNSCPTVTLMARGYSSHVWLQAEYHPCIYI